MVIDTLKEKISVNKLVACKKEILYIEGDIIVPDAKPDILNTICTSGVVSIYKKEIQDGKIRIDGNINTYIMYLADDVNDKVRGITTNLDFTETILLNDCKDGMIAIYETKLKAIDAKVINGRKIGIKASLEVYLKVYDNEEIQTIKEVKNCENIQMMKEEKNVNILVGHGETKVYAKDTITIGNTENLAEILKINTYIGGKDVKVSYNKILNKAELNLKIMYLTEENKINTVNAKIPIVGFIDIPSVSEENVCDINYEIRNVVIKPNSMEEHSIYVEFEIGVVAIAYENKNISIIQDLYSPIEQLDFEKKKIKTIAEKKIEKEIKQIRERIKIDGIIEDSVFDVDVLPVIIRENVLKDRTIYEGEIQLKVFQNKDSFNYDVKLFNISFEHIIEHLNSFDDFKADINLEIISQEFEVKNDGELMINIDMQIEKNIYKDVFLNIIEEIESSGEKEDNDYSLIMYIVKKGDTLWKIGKRYGSVVDDIVKINNIENENLIVPGQKLYIPKFIIA